MNNCKSTESLPQIKRRQTNTRRENKPGELFISSQTRAIILEIKLNNSPDRTGRIVSEDQRQQILRQMEVEMAIAKKEDRRADVNFFENQCDKIRKRKLSKN